MKIKALNIRQIEENLQQINTVLSINMNKIKKSYTSLSQDLKLYPVEDIIDFCKEHEDTIVSKLNIDCDDDSTLIMNIIKYYDQFSSQVEVDNDIDMNFIVRDIYKYDSVAKEQSLNTMLAHINTIRLYTDMKIVVLRSNDVSETIEVTSYSGKTVITDIEKVVRIVLHTKDSCIVADTVQSDKELLKLFISKYSDRLFDNDFVEYTLSKLKDDNTTVHAHDMHLYLSTIEGKGQAEKIVQYWFDVANSETELKFTDLLLKYGGCLLNNIDVHDVTKWYFGNLNNTQINMCDNESEEEYFKRLIRMYRFQNR